MLKPCKTLDEFVLKYDKDLERILCKSFKNYINIDDLQEVKNDVYIHLLEKNFFETYDPTKAQFSTYLYAYLFKFLKSKRVREDKEVTKYALSTDMPTFQDSNVTILDLHDFNPKFTPIDNLEFEDLEKKIKELLSRKLKNLKIHNPYKTGTIESFAWNCLLTPKTAEELEAEVAAKLQIYEKNPYHAKKDSVKHQIWESFKNLKQIAVTSENILWENVPGVKKMELDFSKFTWAESEIFNFIAENRPSFFEIGQGLPGLDPDVIEIVLLNLERHGFVSEAVKGKGKKANTYYQPRFRPYFTFDRVKNLTWHLLFYFKERHPELFEFNDGYYSLNTTSNVTFKLFQMIQNGKTKKEIANTYRVNNNFLSHTKDVILRDLKKLVTN